MLNLKLMILLHEFVRHVNMIHESLEQWKLLRLIIRFSLMVKEVWIKQVFGLLWSKGRGMGLIINRYDK